MKKIYTLLLLAFFLTSGRVMSQFNYPLASATIVAGTYTDLGTSGTAITTKFTGGTLTYDDDTSSVQNIGFNFVYNSTTFTQFVLGTNGFIKLGNTSPTDTYDPLNSTNSNLIVPFGGDLEGAPGAEYRVATTGVAGSRICTIQYKSVKDYGQGGVPAQSQYSSANFQIRLYESSNNIEFVYGTFTPSLNPTNINAATVGIIGNNPTVSVNATKASTAAWTAATFVSGPYTANYFNNRNTVLPVSGTTVRFVAVAPAANDVSIENIYPLGSNGKGLQNVVRAYIKNNGSTTKTNLQVTLSVTGANTFTTTFTIASLPVGTAGFLTFPQYTSSNLGTNTVTVSVPADDVTTNDSKTASQEITTNQINYHIGTTTSGFIGDVGSGSEIAAKFAVPYPNTLSKVDVYFSAAGNPFDVIIYNNVAGAPGTAIGTATGQTSVAGLNNVTFLSAVAVKDSFWVSIKQTGLAINYSFQSESPLRPNAFFLKSGTNPWFDLAGNPANTFRFMVGITTSLALPVTLTNFSGRLEGDDAALTWSTATEINNTGFEVERSSDGSNFKTIGFVAGAGNSSSVLNYQFFDRKIPSGTNYYRLKQIDKDGRSVSSSVVQLKRAAKHGFEVTMINPSKGRVSIQINSDNSELISLSLYTINGQLISTQKAAVGAGNNAISIGENLLRGSYIVNILKKGETSSYKVIVE